MSISAVSRASCIHAQTGTYLSFTHVSPHLAPPRLPHPSAEIVSPGTHADAVATSVPRQPDCTLFLLRAYGI